jgi:hypothetical protein
MSLTVLRFGSVNRGGYAVKKAKAFSLLPTNQKEILVRLWQRMTKC